MYDGTPFGAGVLAYNREPYGQFTVPSRALLLPVRSLLRRLSPRARPRCASTETARRARTASGCRSTIPRTSRPGPPVDVGATDFTIEFWMRAAADANAARPVTCGTNADWKSGNVLVDRDRSAPDRKFGVSVAGGARGLRRQRRRDGRPHDLRRAPRSRRRLASRGRGAPPLRREDVDLRRRHPRRRSRRSGRRRVVPR